MVRPKIIYLVSEDWYFCSHRLPVARAARDAGWEVVVLTRLNEHVETIRAEGFRALPLRLKRGSRNPLSSLASVANIAAAYRRERPDLVHHVNLKMCLLGSLAARLTHVPRVVNGLTGMGYLFTADDGRSRPLRTTVLTSLRVLGNLPAVRLIVQNQDDLKMLLDRRVAAQQNTVLIRGSGVDLVRFRPWPEPAASIPTVTYVGRMLADKGLHELAEAARLLQRRGRRLRIALVGPTDPENPQSLDPATLRRWHAEGVVDWLGYRADIADLWAQSAIGVLPSYREGLPKSLLEAAACARPLIATDVPGCRDLVRDGENGLLVPPKDPAALADAIERLLASPELRQRLGRAARATVETEFSEEAVVDATLALYRSLMSAG